MSVQRRMVEEGRVVAAPVAATRSIQGEGTRHVPMGNLLLHCRICDVTVTLDPDPQTRIVEVRTSAAAHNTHEEGLGVVLDLDVELFGENPVNHP